MTRRIALLVLFLIAVPGGPAVAQTSSAYAYADDDIWILEDCTQDCLENAETNPTSDRENPDTQTTRSVTPIETFQNEVGQYCREYQKTITIEGRQHRAYGTACRMPDGSWQVVRGEMRASAPPARFRRRGAYRRR